MELIALLKDLTHGISYIHSNGVIHRDIKIDNVILKHNVCKITDFGVSSVGEISQTFVGTPVYLAPEIMNNRVYNDAYDKTVDIWAWVFSPSKPTSESIPSSTMAVGS
jgi:serine/threonine protein kinase